MSGYKIMSLALWSRRMRGGLGPAATPGQDHRFGKLEEGSRSLFRLKATGNRLARCRAWVRTFPQGRSPMRRVSAPVLTRQQDSWKRRPRPFRGTVASCRRRSRPSSSHAVASELEGIELLSVKRAKGIEPSRAPRQARGSGSGSLTASCGFSERSICRAPGNSTGRRPPSAALQNGQIGSVDRVT
jgi:hypothetical protein